MPIKRVFKPIQYFIENVSDEASREILENRFLQVEGLRRIAVEKSRSAALAVAASRVAEANAVSAELEFLELAKEHFPMIATEALWQPYRDGNGKVIIESLFTSRDQRNATRAARVNLERQIDGDYGEMFESTDSDDE